MLTDFQQQKMKHLFHFWDRNDSGKLDKTDFDEIAERISTERGWAKGSTEQARIHNAMSATWGQMRQFADNNADTGITITEWMVYCDTVIRDMPTYRISVIDMMTALLNAVDQDDDGSLTVDDYKMWFRVFGKDEVTAEETFRKLDTDGSNALEISELIGAVDDFYHSEEASAPGNVMFGTLDKPTET